MKPTVIIITGPTASGKSRLALLLAKKLKAEIISADSMQVYKGMDIGTDKPTRAERAKIKHHLIDIISPARKFSVFDYLKLAQKKIKAIHKKKKNVIVAGGTGLYIRALLNGLDQLPAQNLALRKKWESLASQFGKQYAHDHLVKISPERAVKIHPNNLRRVIRAIEISEDLKSGGKKIPGLIDLGYEVFVFSIDRNREEIYSRIERRVELMFKRGLVKEVLKLRQIKISDTAKQALGYKEIFCALNAKNDPQTVLSDIQKNTRHFAKRQMTWFRREPGLITINCSENKKMSKVLAEILSFLKRPKIPVNVKSS